MLNRIYHRVINKPKDILSFISEDTTLNILPDKNSRYSSLMSLKVDLKVILKSLYGLDNSKIDQNWMDLRNISINPNNPKIFLRCKTVENRPKTGKTLLTKVVALYELYRLTFESHIKSLSETMNITTEDDNFCIIIYTADSKSTSLLGAQLYEMIKNTNSLDEKFISFYYDYDLNNKLTLLKSRSCNSVPALVIIDDCDSISNRQFNRIITLYPKSNFLFIGTNMNALKLPNVIS